MAYIDVAYCSRLARTELFLHTPRKGFKICLVASKEEATLKGKNSVQEGVKFLPVGAAHVVKKQNYFTLMSLYYAPTIFIGDGGAYSITAVRTFVRPVRKYNVQNTQVYNHKK